MKQVLSVVAAVLIALTSSVIETKAQSRFSPALQVGDSVVTRYQLDQRTLFLSLLNAPGDPRDLAREQLINEAIQIEAATAAGYAPSAAALDAGLAEFASRADLTTAEFETALVQNGVDPETFREFIRVGVAWRNYLREEFGAPIRASVPDPLVTRLFTQTGTEGGERYQLLELMLPANTPETVRASLARADEILALDSETAFSSAARRFSTLPSRASGGQRPWVAAETLPPEVVAVLTNLDVGEISRPLTIDGLGIIIYYMRDREFVRGGTSETLDVDYALFLTGPDTAAPETIAARVDRCDDLYGVARGLPEDRLIRETTALSALPTEIRLLVEAMDINETSTVIQRNGSTVVLMLCNRTTSTKSDVDREIVGTRLLNNRLGAVAENILANLRSDVTIIDLTE